jgi:hypothetical protein
MHIVSELLCCRLPNSLHYNCCSVVRTLRVSLHIVSFADASHYLRRIEPNSRTTLIDEQSNPSQLVHQEDVMSRHRLIIMFGMHYD